MPGVHEPLSDALLDPLTYSGDLHGALGRLRRQTPVAWNESLGFWALTCYSDVLEVSRDPGRFCSAQGILLEEIGVTYPSPPTMMHTDPPAHTRLRGLLRPGFTNAAVRSIEPLVRQRADHLLDQVAELAAGNRSVDITAALSVRLPIQVIAAVLGLGPQASRAGPDGTVGSALNPMSDDEERLFRWSEAAVPGATDWPEEERMALLGEMTVALLELAAERRAAPRDDIVSMLAAYEGEEDGTGRPAQVLSTDELGMFLVQLLVAGNETTRHAISGALVTLAERPEQLARLADDPTLIGTAVEEVLRWTTPVASFMRTTTRDTTLSGVLIAAGDPVLLVYSSANRDEAEFGPSAGTFDVGRSPNRHLAFGYGPHFCIGAGLARLELAVVLEGVVERWARLELAGPVERSGSSVIAGISSAPLRLFAH